jgi:hypothetical protein
MQSAQKHTFINTKNLQGSNFFRTFKYCLVQHSTAQYSTVQHSTAQYSTAQYSTVQYSTAQYSTAQYSTAQYSTAQHSLKQLIFSLLLFCSLFSFAQEENVTSFYVNPNTTVFGLEHISSVQVQELQHKEKPKLYIVENSIFYAPQDFSIVTIASKTALCTNVNKKNKVLDLQSAKTKVARVQPQTKTQVIQLPLPFSLPVKQETAVTAITTTTVTPTTFSKTINKLFVFDDFFSLHIRKVLSKKQNTTCYNQNSKPFQIKTKHCNRPPPDLYC